MSHIPRRIGRYGALSLTAGGLTAALIGMSPVAAAEDDETPHGPAHSSQSYEAEQHPAPPKTAHPVAPGHDDGARPGRGTTHNPAKPGGGQSHHPAKPGHGPTKPSHQSADTPDAKPPTTIGGGQNNTATGPPEILPNSVISTPTTTIGGGQNNTATGPPGVLPNSVISGSTTTIGGGQINVATGPPEVLPNSVISGSTTTIGGGQINVATGPPEILPPGHGTQIE